MTRGPGRSAPGALIEAPGGKAEVAVAPAMASGRLGRRVRKAMTSSPVIFVAVLAGMVGFWALVVAAFRVQFYILPSPWSVVRTGADDWRPLMDNTASTAVEVALGFGLAAAVGVMLGTLMFYFRPVEKLLSPPIVSFQNVPKVALAPLFVVWFGHATMSRVLVAFLMAFFPVLVNTMAGLRSTKAVSVELVRSMGASKLEVFRKVQFPSALPNVFAGLRVATTLVVIGAIVGEYIASNSGLGYLQLQATNTENTALVFAAVIMMAILGLVSYEIVVLVERLAIPWTKTPSQ